MALSGKAAWGVSLWQAGEAAVLVFTGEGHVLAEPLRRREGTGFVFGSEFHLGQDQAVKFPLEYVQLDG